MTTTDVPHLTTAELESGLDVIRQSPKDDGVIEMIVRRPAPGEREVLRVGVLDAHDGLVGDNWRTRGNPRTPDGLSHPDMQINIMNARAVALIAGGETRWPLAGDQLFVDLDLSGVNLPPGTRLSLGEAVLEVTEIPHLGCQKFVTRFGVDAMKFVNSPLGRELCLRGINAKVVRPGTIRPGDAVRKIG